MDRYDVEDIVLEMAAIVKENQYLRKENERLKEVERKYNKEIFERCRASEEASRNMLKAAIVGISMGKDDKQLASELLECM